MWFWVVVVVLMIGAVTILLVGSGSTLSDVYEDRPDRTVPVGRPLTADDLGEIRFTTAMRGYRMDEVDALVDRLRADLLVRESAQAASDATQPATIERDREPDVESTRPIPMVSSEQPTVLSDETRPLEAGSTTPDET